MITESRLMEIRNRHAQLKNTSLDEQWHQVDELLIEVDRLRKLTGTEVDAEIERRLELFEKQGVRWGAYQPQPNRYSRSVEKWINDHPEGGVMNLNELTPDDEP